MTIREATTADVEGIQRVAEASWEVDYPDILSRESVEEGVHDWYSSVRIRDSIQWRNSYLLVYRRDDEVVGFVHGELLEEDELGHVVRLYVHPDHRGEGIGRDLLEAACRTLVEEGAARIRAMVLSSNEVGNAFYREFGFEAEETTEINVGNDTYSETTYELRDDVLQSLTDADAWT